jgi:glycosyltransferase involved in cell wall biosynthesis
MISLVVTVHNEKRELLEACFNSLFSQKCTNVSFEVIAVDDASTSIETVNYLKELELHNPSFFLCRSETNIGLNSARQLGVLNASGDHILFVDADDQLLPNSLFYFGKEIESCDPCVILAPMIKKTGPSAETDEQICEDSDLDIGKHGSDALRALFQSNFPFQMCGKIYKRTLLSSWVFDMPSKMFHEDLVCFPRIISNATKISYIHKPSYIYSERVGSITSSFDTRHIMGIFYGINSWVDLASDKLGEDCPKALVWRRAQGLIKHCIKLSILKNYDFTDKIFDQISHIIRALEASVFSDMNEDVVAITLLKKIKSQVGAIEFFVKNPDSDPAVVVRNLLSKSVGIKNHDAMGEIGIKRLQISMKYSERELDKIITSHIPILSSEEIRRLSYFKDKYFGHRCFIVGNGPSLNEHDLTYLKNEYSFGVNSIFLKTETDGFKPTFYVVEDNHVVEDNIEEIEEYDVEYKFVPAQYRQMFSHKPNNFWLPADMGFYRGVNHPYGGIPRFSEDCSQVIFAGQSVTYMNLQLAFHMGFSEVFLIGMDFEYTKPSHIVENTPTSWTSNGDDPNHFDPRYFGHGKSWHDPQLDKVALNFEFAKRQYQNAGRRLLNATIGGKLEIFERCEWSHLFPASRIVC